MLVIIIVVIVVIIIFITGFYAQTHIALTQANTDPYSHEVAGLTLLK